MTIIRKLKLLYAHMLINIVFLAIMGCQPFRSCRSLMFYGNFAIINLYKSVKDGPDPTVGPVVMLFFKIRTAPVTSSNIMKILAYTLLRLWFRQIPLKPRPPKFHAMEFDYILVARFPLSPVFK